MKSREFPGNQPYLRYNYQHHNRKHKMYLSPPNKLGKTGVKTNNCFLARKKINGISGNERKIMLIKFSGFGVYCKEKKCYFVCQEYTSEYYLTTFLLLHFCCVAKP